MWWLTSLSITLRSGLLDLRRTDSEAVRESAFWHRLDGVLGSSYSRSWAKDHVLSDFGNRTVLTALAAGVEAKVIWRAVCRDLELPEHLR